MELENATHKLTMPPIQIIYNTNIWPETQYVTSSDD